MSPHFAALLAALIALGAVMYLPLFVFIWVGGVTVLIGVFMAFRIFLTRLGKP